MQSIFYVRPSAQEIVETAVTLREPDPPVLLGTVTDDSGKPVSHALAVLYASGCTPPDAYKTASAWADTRPRRVLEQPEE